MKDQNRMVQDGIMLAAAYHFLMAVVFVIGFIAIIFYAVIPPLVEQNPEGTQSLFLPVVGLLVSVALAIGYGYVGSGLTKLKNSARMAAVFLALFGLLGGVFGVAGVLATTINTVTAPDLVRVGVIGLFVMGINFISILDIFLLFFLFQQDVRALFYGMATEEVRAETPMMRPSRPSPAAPSPAVRRRPTPGSTQDLAD
jgi:hypothetical protein